MSDLTELAHKTQKYIGRRIKYTKSGNRSGWTGLIKDINTATGRMLVVFDNTIEQAYRVDALICEESNTGYGYLSLLPEDTTTTIAPNRATIKAGDVLVIDPAILKMEVEKAKALALYKSKMVVNMPKYVSGGSGKGESSLEAMTSMKVLEMLGTPVTK